MKVHLIPKVYLNSYAKHVSIFHETPKGKFSKAFLAQTGCIKVTA